MAGNMCMCDVLDCTNYVGYADIGNYDLSCKEVIINDTNGSSCEIFDIIDDDRPESIYVCKMCFDNVMDRRIKCHECDTYIYDPDLWINDIYYCRFCISEQIAIEFIENLQNIASDVKNNLHVKCKWPTFCRKMRKVQTTYINYPSKKRQIWINIYNHIKTRLC